MTTTSIAIIGAGNMGASLLGGLISNNYQPTQLWITDPDSEKLQKLKSQLHVNTTTDNLEAIENADVIILAVKPQILSTVAQTLSQQVQEKKPLVISIAAGIQEKNLQSWLGGNIPIVRAMPNTPAIYQCGATAAISNSFVTKSHQKLADSILSAVGLVVWVEDETLLDTITALSGSGPAYFFLVIEALQNAAIDLGVPADIARKLTLQTALGAARMAVESRIDVVELRNQVTSPKGTTESAIKVLEENKIREIFKKAICAGKKRSEELAAAVGKN